MKNLLLSAAALLLAPGAIYSVDEPPLKEGFWTIRTQMTQNPGNTKEDTTRSVCRNHAYDAYTRSTAKKTNCKTISESTSGTTTTTDSECKVNDIVIRNKGTLTVTGDTATRSEAHTTYTPAFGGVTESTMTTDQKYLGSCPAGVQPGDLTTADGKVNHLWKH